VVDSADDLILAVISLSQLKNELRLDGTDAALTRLAVPYSVVEE
jgi:hypothetical protein